MFLSLIVRTTNLMKVLKDKQAGIVFWSPLNYTEETSPCRQPLVIHQIKNFL